MIRTNGLVGLFQTEDGIQKKCKILVDALPAILKKKVKNEIDFRAPNAKSSVPDLFKLILEQALDQDKIDGQCVVRRDNAVAVIGKTAATRIERGSRRRQVIFPLARPTTKEIVITRGRGVAPTAKWW